MVIQVQFCCVVFRGSISEPIDSHKSRLIPVLESASHSRWYPQLPIHKLREIGDVDLKITWQRIGRVKNLSSECQLHMLLSTISNICSSWWLVRFVILSSTIDDNGLVKTKSIANFALTQFVSNFGSRCKSYRDPA